MLKDRYVFPAVFDYADDGITVTFPDLPGCITCGNTDEEVLIMAKDALMLRLYSDEADGSTIPAPTKLKDVTHEPHQAVVLVDVWMIPFRDKMMNKSVKKTLTIPKWLDDIAKESNVNYSAILQNALKKHLDIKEPRL